MGLKQYEQQKFGITYHFAWVLGLDWGEKDNFEKTDYLLRDHSKVKQFDYPYLLTMSARNGGWIRYQILSAFLHGHRVNLVSHFIEVNPNEKPMEIDSGWFHCVDCGLLGTEETLFTYPCHSIEIDWMEECGCPECKKRIPCIWAKVSMICHGNSTF